MTQDLARQKGIRTRRQWNTKRTTIGRFGRDWFNRKEPWLPSILKKKSLFDYKNVLIHFLSDPSPIIGYSCHSLQLTHLTHWLTHWLPFSKLNWCDPGVWRCLLKTCWSCYCCWCKWWGSCWQQFVADLEAEVSLRLRSWILVNILNEARFGW